MRTSRQWLTVALASLAATVLADPVTAAEELTAASFTSFIQSAEVAMVDFYAPWCGHCQRFGPKFDEAAKRIAAAELNAKLGKVDCTIYQQLCRDKGINLYPTMKIYKQGKELYHEYTGPRRTSAIVEFVQKQILPVITHITTPYGMDQFLKQEHSEVVLIGYIDDNDQTSKDKFSAAAEKLHEDFPIGLVSHPDVIKHKGVAKTPSVVLYEPWEGAAVVYDGNFEVEAIKTFAQSAYTPLVGELNGASFNTYTQNTATGFLFAKLGDDIREWTDKLKPIAKTRKLRMAVADTTEFSGFADFLASAGDGPAFAIYNPQKRQKFALDGGSNGPTTDTIARFVDDFLSEKLSPSIKSQPVPTSQDGPVTIVVAKTFDQIVMDPTKDVLINFFREECPYCRALAPTWDALGDLYQKHQLTDHLVIASIDAMKNELADKPQYVPTIKLYKAGDKANPVLYNGDRSIQDLVQFVKEHSTYQLDANTMAAPDQPIADQRPVVHGQSPMVYRHDEL